jgi:hypothetical protein
MVRACGTPRVLKLAPLKLDRLTPLQHVSASWSHQAQRVQYGALVMYAVMIWRHLSRPCRLASFQNTLHTTALKHPLPHCQLQQPPLHNQVAPHSTVPKAYQHLDELQACQPPSFSSC